ncbi:Uncharacterised protein [Nocardia otitidiscaviarum]|uniref:Uncharacterized protein n=1 Tax=Nocardia otitidiscaviarum TaxID=1823 RepID=A0A378YSK6_9NOCA|nr:Uncharacterised protein [Nocardia otitidiscaviarum]
MRKLGSGYGNHPDIGADPSGAAFPGRTLLRNFSAEA